MKKQVIRRAVSRKKIVRGPPSSVERGPGRATPISGVDHDAPQESSRSLQTARCCELERLYNSLGRVTRANDPRTFRLLEGGTRTIAQKVIEEAGEVALEAVKHHDAGVVRESADLLYHLVVLWCRTGVEPLTVWQEMQTRASAFGLAEKLPKTAFV